MYQLLSHVPLPKGLLDVSRGQTNLYSLPAKTDSVYCFHNLCSEVFSGTDTFINKTHDGSQPATQTAETLQLEGLNGFLK